MTATATNSLRLALAHRVRDACEVYFGRGGKRAIRMAGKCHAINGSLVLAFHAQGIAARPVAGWFHGGPELPKDLRDLGHPGRVHCWVASGRWYWDLAARQFGKGYPRVLVTPKDDPRYLVPIRFTSWYAAFEQKLVEAAMKPPDGPIYIRARRILDAAGIPAERAS